MDGVAGEPVDSNFTLFSGAASAKRLMDLGLGGRCSHAAVKSNDEDRGRMQSASD